MAQWRQHWDWDAGKWQPTPQSMAPDRLTGRACGQQTLMVLLNKLPHGRPQPRLPLLPLLLSPPAQLQHCTVAGSQGVHRGHVRNSTAPTQPARPTPHSSAPLLSRIGSLRTDDTTCQVRPNNPLFLFTVTSRPLSLMAPADTIGKRRAMAHGGLFAHTPPTFWCAPDAKPTSMS